MEREEYETKEFIRLGFDPAVEFEIIEMNGWYKIDTKERVVYDVSLNTRTVVVKGMYENMLRGVYHKKVRRWLG